MKEFLEWTAWPMETPQVFGSFHIIFAVVGLIVCIVGAWLLRKTTEKQNKIILGVIGGFLILTEVYKQLFYVFVKQGGGYPWWIFPWQLCSVPMYLCIACIFIKSEKVKSWLYNFMFAFNLFGGFVSLIYPSGLHHEYWTLTLHAYIWHLLLVFLGFYLFVSGRAGKNWKDYFKAISVFAITAVIAQIINIIVTPIDAGINMYYISPYRPSSIIFFDKFWIQNGWVANMFLYLFALCLGAAIFYYSFYGFRKLHEYRKHKKHQL